MEVRILKTFFSISLNILLVCFSASHANAQVDPNLRQRLDQNGAIIVNRHSVGLFDQIPDTYLQRARNIRMMWADRSVGGNISEGLNCLASSSWSSAPSSCRRDYYDISPPVWSWKTYSSTDYQNGLVPSRILFNADSTKYNRSNWVFYFDPGQGVTPELSCSNSTPWVGCFIQHVRNNSSQYDVFSYQHSYLAIQPGSDITGYFQDNPSREDIYDYARLETDFPSKAFFYWTTSLSRDLGSSEGQQYGSLMRQFVTQNKKILFDVADILSYTGNQPCYDTRDGVEYCNANGTCENYPDDGQNYPAICQDYTTEFLGGHLGSVSGGKIMLAKAYWVLMAQIAGWQPGTAQTPPPTAPPTSTPRPTATPTTHPTATATPTSSPVPGDANGDGRVDGLDYVIWLNNFGQQRSGASFGDFDNSGNVDGIDYVIWLNNYSG